MPHNTKIATKPSVRFISLGCPKNLVDSETMAGLLAQGSFEVKPSDSDADVGIINTCGFIEDSKKESIDTILELAREKKAGRLKLLVVTGCLSQRYATELPKLLPEVDAFVGTGDFSRLASIITEKMGGTKKRNFIEKPSELPSAENPRIHTTPFYTRYVKISEGCSHTCSFCTIPLMRGGLKSRMSHDVIQEVKNGVDQGVKEFNLIAQDLNEYGRDLQDRDSLFNLLQKLGEIPGNFWLRPLYMYPLQFPDRLISLMKDHPHLIPYVDIPLQHIDDAILKSMRRGSSSRYIHRLISKLRNEIPGIVIRTTFIAGYPGETKSAFAKLLKFVEQTEFDNVGVFTYSEEEQTRAAKLARAVPRELRIERRGLLMEAQQKIAAKKNRARVGEKLQVLFEGSSTEEGFWGKGRFYGQAPEIDGLVWLRKPSSNQAIPERGDFVEVTVAGSTDYDLIGEIGSTISSNSSNSFNV